MKDEGFNMVHGPGDVKKSTSTENGSWQDGTSLKKLKVKEELVRTGHCGRLSW